VQRFFGLGANVGVGLGEGVAVLLEHAEQQRLGGRIVAFGERAYRRETGVLVLARQLDRRMRHS
jgi:hypothetical protein